MAKKIKKIEVLNQELLDKMNESSKSLKDADIKKELDELEELGNELHNNEEIQAKLNDVLELTIKKKDEYDSSLKDLNSKLEKIKEIDAKSKSLAKHLEDQKKDLDNEKKSWRKEEESLRGKSKVDKILILIKGLKDSIIVKNQITELLKLDCSGIDIDSLNNIQKKIIREFGDYEFYVDDAKACQSKINDIIKILTSLFKNASIDSINEFENRSYFKARGILKALHIRLNPFDNHIHSKESKPIELMRIFSVLEPTISSLSGLDTESIDSEDYDKVIKSFNEFIIEEKQNFMRTYFDESYVEILDQKILKNIFVKILNRFVLTPEQLLEQMSKWQSINKEYINKFIEFLRIELTPLQKIQIADNEIKDMKAKGLL